MLGADLPPARFAGRHDHPQFERRVRQRFAFASDPFHDHRNVVGVRHRPGRPRGLVEGHRLAGDLDEFRSAPEGLGLQVHLVDARAPGLQGQAQSLRIGLSLAPRGHQRRDVMTVHQIGQGLAIDGGDRTVFAMQPAPTALIVEVAFLVLDEVLAGGRATMTFADAVRQSGDGLLDPQAQVGPPLEVGDLLPGRAGRATAALRIEHRHRSGRTSRRGDGHFEPPAPRLAGVQDVTDVLGRGGQRPAPSAARDEDRAQRHGNTVRTSDVVDDGTAPPLAPSGLDRAAKRGLVVGVTHQRQQFRHGQGLIGHPEQAGQFGWNRDRTPSRAEQPDGHSGGLRQGSAEIVLDSLGYARHPTLACRRHRAFPAEVARGFVADDGKH